MFRVVRLNNVNTVSPFALTCAWRCPHRSLFNEYSHGRLHRGVKLSCMCACVCAAVCLDLWSGSCKDFHHWSSAW